MENLAKKHIEIQNERRVNMREASRKESDIKILFAFMELELDIKKKKSK